MLTCTENAAKHILRQIAKRPNAVGVRIGVRTSGYSGLAYTMEFCETIGEQDQVFDSHGAQIIINAKELTFLAGTEIHYARKGVNEGFEFKNPKEVARCGCGESFAVA